MPCGQEEVLPLIQREKKSAAAVNFVSEVKVQLHVYLFPLLRPFRGPRSLWSPAGEQVLNASQAAAAVLAEHVSRVVRLHLSASHCGRLRLKLCCVSEIHHQRILRKVHT